MPPSESPEPRAGRGIPLWPFLLAAPLLLGIAALLSLWLPELTERAARRRLESLPGTQISRTAARPGTWPWIPRHRYTEWLHLLCPPQPGEFNVRLMAGFPREEFFRIGSLRRIGHLDATGIPLTDGDVGVLTRIPYLRSLVLDDTPVGDEGVISLVRRPSLVPAPLTHLSLKNTRITDAAIPWIANQTRLVQLTLNGTAITGSEFAALSRLTNLVQLRLGRTLIDDAALAHLAGCPRMGSLDLYATRITDAGLPALGALTQLTSLSLDRTEVGDAGLAAFFARRRRGRHPLYIGRLSLKHTRVTGPGLSKLKVDIRHLALSGTTVGDEAFDWFLSGPILSQLELDHTRFTDAGLARLANSRSLFSVNLTGCPIEEATAIRFIESAPWRPRYPTTPPSPSAGKSDQKTSSAATTPALPPHVLAWLQSYRQTGWLRR